MGDPIGIGNAEDGADDHIQRDRLSDRARVNGLPWLPVVDLAVGALLDDLGIVRDRLAVKRRQHQLAHAHVALPVEQQNRRSAGHRCQHLSRLPDDVLVRLPLEHLLDQVTVGDVEDLAGDRVCGAEHRAVAAARGQPCLDGANNAQPRLKQARHTRAGGRRGRPGACKSGLGSRRRGSFRPRHLPAPLDAQDVKIS